MTTCSWVCLSDLTTCTSTQNSKFIRIRLISASSLQHGTVFRVCMFRCKVAFPSPFLRKQVVRAKCELQFCRFPPTGLAVEWLACWELVSFHVITVWLPMSVVIFCRGATLVLMNALAW